VLSEAAAATVMLPVTACPAVGLVMETVGAVRSTVMLTPAEVVLFPAASRATAVRVWAPTASDEVLSEMLYGDAVSSEP